MGDKVDAFTQTSCVQQKHFSHGADGGQGIWEDENVEMRKEIGIMSGEPKSIKFTPIINLNFSKKMTQNQTSQTEGRFKDKAVQTTWKIYIIDVDSLRKSNRERLEEFIKQHQFAAIQREFTVPQLLSPIKEPKDSGEEEKEKRRIKETEERKIYAEQIDKDAGNIWRKWGVDEFVWENEENICPKKNEEDIAQGVKRKEMENKEKEKILKKQKIEILKDTELKQPPRLHKKDLATLNGVNWLNDEVINAYFELIDKEGNNRTYSMSSFFFTRLYLSGYSSIKRWTKRINIFERDVVFVPVHLGNHWCLAVIQMKIKTIEYYDSLMGDDKGCMNILLGYLEEEAKEKKNEEFRRGEWNLNIKKEIPRQTNGHDCGVFVCAFAKQIALQNKINFSQDDIPEIRLIIKNEIQERKLNK